MYYDLVTSLPHLPHFEQAERLSITSLRLQQRLRLLKPAHADQLALATALVRWRPDHQSWKTNAAMIKEYAAVMASPLERPLRQYVTFRMDQRTLVAALRQKREGMPSLDGTTPWGTGAWGRHIQRHWDEPDFHLARLVPWLPQARELLAAGDAEGIERLLMDAAWRWLDHCTERDMFGFEAVFSYFFKWDILRAWLAHDAEKGRTRFKTLIDQVTHVEHS